MKVTRDFDLVYESEEDPWGIGDAHSARYDRYVELLLSHAGSRGSLLDIGSGFGALLARFSDDFDELVGVDVSAEAVRKGAERFPEIAFHLSRAEELAGSPVDGRRFDAILCSDVICYLEDEDKRRLLEWIARHVAPSGIAFVAAWSPGGDYLTPDELHGLVDERFVVQEEQLLEEGHLAVIARPRRRLVALTVDYETWQPIPAGRRIDWDADVLAPTTRLLEACDAEGARLTLFAEMGEYFWLREREPLLAARMEEQWRDAVRRGHDVQLHLHPNWLPETGARHNAGGWWWDDRLALADEFPGDLSSLLSRCKAALESAIRPVDPGFEATAFRAGGYEAQPFERLAGAMRATGIGCDSSVYWGPPREGRHFDYSLAFSRHQPYFASKTDPQLKAPPAEHHIVELPIATLGFGERWTFDGDEGERFADGLIGLLKSDRPPTPRTERHLQRARTLLGTGYYHLRAHRPIVNRLLPKRLAYTLCDYPEERLVDDDFFVLVGHTKADLDVSTIREGIRRLREEGAVEFIPVTEMASLAREQLIRRQSADRAQEADRQVRREYDAVLGTDRNEAQSFRLQDMIPLDRTRILDLGCGAGDWSARIAERHPWMRVVGIDVGEDFIAHAARVHGSERVGFQVDDFGALSVPDGSFDCVYADNSLEHAYDVDATLAEVHRVLADGGVLLAAIPSDARNPSRITDNHTWKTAPADVGRRLQRAGFADVRIEEVDVYRRLGMAPYPPARDRMMYVRARRRTEPTPPVERLDELTAWVHRSLDPTWTSTSQDPLEIVAGGHAWCAGFTLALGHALEREGFDVRWVTMVADDHPRGRGSRRTDTHETLEVGLDGGTRVVVDPTVGVRFRASLAALLADPTLADVERERDARYLERGYDLYATSFWYSRVHTIAVRRSMREAHQFVPAAWAKWATSPAIQAAAAARGILTRVRRA